MIYEVMHLSRAVDSLVAQIVLKFDPNWQPSGMGKGLYKLVSLRPQYYDEASRDVHVRRVSKERNRYLHTADCYPVNVQEVETFLSSCHACMSWVLNFSNHR